MSSEAVRPRRSDYARTSVGVQLALPHNPNTATNTKPDPNDIFSKPFPIFLEVLWNMPRETYSDLHRRSITTPRGYPTDTTAERFPHAALRFLSARISIHISKRAPRLYRDIYFGIVYGLRERVESTTTAQPVENASTDTDVGAFSIPRRGVRRQTASRLSFGQVKEMNNVLTDPT